MNFPGHSGKRKGQSRWPLGSFPARMAHEAHRRGQGCWRMSFSSSSVLFTHLTDSHAFRCCVCIKHKAGKEHVLPNHFSVREHIKNPPQNTSRKMPDSPVQTHHETLNDYVSFKHKWQQPTTHGPTPIQLKWKLPQRTYQSPWGKTKSRCLTTVPHKQSDLICKKTVFPQGGKGKFPKANFVSFPVYCCYGFNFIS